LVGIACARTCIAGEVRVRAREHERGALHRSAHAEAVADAARERRLARAERAREQHEVARAEPAGELPAERLHRRRVGDVDTHQAPPT